MNLSKKQKAAIIGMILGDGYLQPTGKKNARLRLEHKKDHASYLLWKVRLLPELFQGGPVFLERIHPLTKRMYSYARHQSNASPALGKLRRLFYPSGKKYIPENLENFLRDDIAFAIWFYDDGYYYKRDRCSYIYLGTVSKKEAEVASYAILKRFSLSSRVLDKKNKGFVLYFSSDQNQKIKHIVEKYNVPVMAYKIPQ